MAVEATPQLRLAAALDNLIGRATTAQQRTNIANRVLPTARREIIAAGLNPDALTAAQGAQWTLTLMHRALRADFQNTVQSVERVAANATADAATTAAVNAALVDIDP